jgi:hypothetical protein
MTDKNPLKCNLGRMQPKQIDAEKIKREGWNNDGILVVKIDDERLSWPEKDLIKQIGDKIYKNKKGEKYGK